MTRPRSELPGFQNLLELVPTAPDHLVNWPSIWALWPCLADLDTCPQDPIHHAEGDVGTHTRMVVEALVCDPVWQALEPLEQGRLFWAAVLHDIGKPATTRHEEDGRITSRGHSRVGCFIARRLLWEAGAPFDWREEICGLISAHQLPFWLIERPDPVRLAIETSLKCRADALCLHADADARGRICSDQNAILENVELARAAFEEAGCLDRPFDFANDESRLGFFEREDRDPHYAAHEEFRCHVTVMSGLPGSGKDTWIANNLPDIPVISLDAIREEIGISASDNQGKVIQAARESAREHLRAGQDFVWNATNISRLIRSKSLGLLRDYGAHIRIVYIEVPSERLFKQNNDRAAAVPNGAIRDLVNKLEPPMIWEAHKVSYVTGP